MSVLQWSKFLNGSGGTVAVANVSTWDAGLALVQNIRSVSNQVLVGAGNATALLALPSDAAWRFVIDNIGPAIVPTFLNVVVVEMKNGEDHLVTTASAQLAVLFINLVFFLASCSPLP